MVAVEQFSAESLVFDQTTVGEREAEEVVFFPFVLVSFHFIEHVGHLLFGTNSKRSLPLVVPKWFAPIFIGFNILHVQNVFDTMLLEFVGNMFRHLPGHFDAV